MCLKRGLGLLMPLCVLGICAIGGSQGWARSENQELSFPREMLMAKSGAADRSTAPVTPLQIQVLSSKISLRASSRPGVNNSPVPLRLRLRASQPGWTLGLVATDLRSQGQTPTVRISAQDILARYAQKGSFNSLQNPVPIMLNVPVGRKDVDVDLMVATGSASRQIANYQGDLLLLASHSSGVELPPIPVTANVEVTCEVTHRIWNNKLYFHFAMPNEELTGTVQGEVSSESEYPILMTLQAPAGKTVNQIPSKKLYQSHIRAAIPLEWNLVANCTLVESANDHISWLLLNHPGQTSYQLKCKVKPSGIQTAGTYRTELKIVLTPQM